MSRGTTEFKWVVVIIYEDNPAVFGFTTEQEAKAYAYDSQDPDILVFASKIEEDE